MDPTAEVQGWGPFPMTLRDPHRASVSTCPQAGHAGREGCHCTWTVYRQTLNAKACPSISSRRPGPPWDRTEGRGRAGGGHAPRPALWSITDCPAQAELSQPHFLNLENRGAADLQVKTLGFGKIFHPISAFWSTYSHPVCTCSFGAELLIGETHRKHSGPPLFPLAWGLECPPHARKGQESVASVAGRGCQEEETAGLCPPATKLGTGKRAALAGRSPVCPAAEEADGGGRRSGWV